MARDAGAKSVYFASAAPAIRYPNVYGIDMPSKGELIAHGRTVEQIADAIGADWLVFQDLDDLALYLLDGIKEQRFIVMINIEEAEATLADRAARYGRAEMPINLAEVPQM